MFLANTPTPCLFPHFPAEHVRRAEAGWQMTTDTPHAPSTILQVIYVS